MQADNAVKQQENAVATLASLRQQAQAEEVAEPSEPLQTDAEILIGFAETCKATTLNNNDAGSDKPQSSAAAVQSKTVTLDLKAGVFDCTGLQIQCDIFGVCPHLQGSLAVLRKTGCAQWVF